MLVPIRDVPAGVEIGQRVGLSEIDVFEVNAAYACDIATTTRARITTTTATTTTTTG